MPPDGRLVLAGDGSVMRLNPDGTVDGTFGRRGHLMDDANRSSSSRGLIRLADGRLLLDLQFAWPTQDQQVHLVLGGHLP